MWRSRLRIAIAPDKVAAVLVGHGRNAAVQRKAAWTCRAGPSDTHRWQAALGVLAEGLGGLQAAGADATVVLSNHFVRYVLLPWSPQVVGAEEQHAMARIIFQEQFGSAAGGWTIRLSDAGYGGASLASAVDVLLPESLAQACQAARLRLVSVQPYLMAAFNRHRRQLASGNLCMVVVEHGKLGFLMRKDGGWHKARTLPLRSQLPEDIATLISREILLAGLPQPARVYLYAPGLPRAAIPAGAGWQAELLDLPPHSGFPAMADAGYGMAMSGAA